MRIIIKSVYLFIIASLFTILFLSLKNKSYLKEYDYSLMSSYCYLSNNQRTFNVEIFSTIKDPSFSYSNRNQYYLHDESNDFYYTLTLNSINKYNVNPYLYELNFNIPKLDDLDIDSCYLRIENEFNTYEAFIGSFYITSDYSENDISYNSFYGTVNENNLLDKVCIELNEVITVKNIKLPNNIKCKWSISNNTLILDLDCDYYLNNIFVIIETNKGILKIDNFYYVTNDIEYTGYENMLSAVVRDKLNDRV